MHLRTWQHQMATIMQPFHCDLQPQIQDTHGTTHTGTATRCRTLRRNQFDASKRPQPHPPHTRGTFHRRLQPLHTEKHKVSCSGFLPKTKPMQHSCSSLQCILQHHVATRLPRMLSTHMATPDDNNHAAIIPLRSATTDSRHAWELRTQEQPLVAEHRGGTDSTHRNDPSRNRRTHEVPFIAGCSHFTRKNTRFRAPASSPKQSPMQQSCSHYNAFCSITWLTRMYLRTWQHQMTTIMQPFHCDLQPHDSRQRIELRTQERGTFHRHSLQNTKEEPIRPRNDPCIVTASLRRTHEVPFIAVKSAATSYTEKHKVSCSGFLPKTKPMQHSCSHYNAFCSIT